MQYSYGQPDNCPPMSSNDRDGDSIPDSLERTGIPGLDLPAKGADPNHKDVFVEVDYLPFHKPTSDDVALLTQAFKNAGDVCNPDGLPGINLHIEVDEEIGPHVDETSIEDVKQIRLEKLGSVNEREHPNSENIITAKSDFYKYAFIGHKYRGVPYSGMADGIPGKSFLVTLGFGPYSVDDNTNHKTGNIYQKTGTFMHELGHTLGLKHAGFEHLPQYKPNYVSVMNYAFQTPSWLGSWALDYSKCKINSLNEDALNEHEGIGPGCFANQKTVIFGKGLGGGSCPFIPRLVPTDNSVINYNLNNNDNEVVSVDLTCNGLKEIDISHNDWKALKKIPADLSFSTQDSLAGVPVNNLSDSSIPVEDEDEPIIELTANDRQAHLLYQIQEIQQLTNKVNCPTCGEAPGSVIEQLDNLAGIVIGGDFDPNVLAQNVTDVAPPLISPSPLPEAGEAAPVTLPQRIINNDWDGAIRQLNILESAAETAQLASEGGVIGVDPLLTTINNFEEVLEKQKPIMEFDETVINPPAPVNLTNPATGGVISGGGDLYKWTFNSPDGQASSTLIADAETAKSVGTSLALMNLNSQRGPVSSAATAGEPGSTTDDSLTAGTIQTSGALVTQVQQQVSQGIDALVQTEKAKEQIEENNPAAGSLSAFWDGLGVEIGIDVEW
jgi:hypothetical protein